MSDNRVKRHSYQRHEIAFRDGRCLYCGEPATDREHVLPLTETNGWERVPADVQHLMILVPACSECNHLAGCQTFTSVKERREYIRRHIRSRYQQALRVPEWDEDQLSQLGPTLRNSVTAATQKRAWVLRRLDYDCEEWGIPLEPLAELAVV